MGKLNMAIMQSKLDGIKNGFGSTNYDRLETGKNVRRVLWPKGDNDNFYSEGWYHYNLGADGKTTVTCPKTFGPDHDCPICEYVATLQKSRSKEDQALASNLSARHRFFINVINRDDDEESIKVLPIGVTILKGLLMILCDSDFGDITDYENGLDVTITKKGQGLNTEYSVMPKRQSSVASEELSEEQIEEAMTDLDSLFVEKSYEELLGLLEDNVEDDEFEDDENDTYDEMDITELKSECKRRGIRIPAKATHLALVTLLTKDDETSDDDDDDFDELDDTDVDDDEADEEDIMEAIAKATSNRKRSRK